MLLGFLFLPRSARDQGLKLMQKVGIVNWFAAFNSYSTYFTKYRRKDNYSSGILKNTYRSMGEKG